MYSVGINFTAKVRKYAIPIRRPVKHYLSLLLGNNRLCPLMWLLWSRQAAQSSRSAHSKVWLQRNPFPPRPPPICPYLLDPSCSSLVGCCSVDAVLVTGTMHSIWLCGLWSLTVAIRSILGWTSDTEWVAASALNYENKYWIGLHCASQARSPIVICLGVHTGGSVCVGPRPPHVVAVRFFSHWITLLRVHSFNKTAWMGGGRIQTRFTHVITFPPLLCSTSLCLVWGRRIVQLQKARELSRCLVEPLVFLRAEREITKWGDVGDAEEGAKRSTWDGSICMFGWREFVLWPTVRFLAGLRGAGDGSAIFCTVVSMKRVRTE